MIGLRGMILMITRKEWRVAIKRLDPVTKKLWEPDQQARVCNDHFTQESFKDLPGNRKRLVDGAVPSIFIFKKPQTPSGKRRADKVAEKRAQKEEKDILEMDITAANVGNEIVIDYEDDMEVVDEEVDVTTKTKETPVQCELLTPTGLFTINRFEQDDRAIKYFTGFDTYAHFTLFLSGVLGPCGKSQLEPKDVIHDRRVASKRIHIERLIGLSKTYAILKKDLAHDKVLIGDRIIFICFMLSNFKRSIVNRLT